MTSESPVRVIAATDGSAASLRAMERAADTAANVDGEVIAVHVMSTMAAFLSDLPDSSFSKTGQRLKQLLDEVWVAPLRAASIPYRTRVVSGPPVKQLLTIATEEDAWCIVAGLTGRDADEHSTIGTTALGLSRQSKHKVILVPPDPQSALVSLHNRLSTA